MGFIRLLTQNKFFITLCLFVYILIWFILASFKQSRNPNGNQFYPLAHLPNMGFFVVLTHLSQLKFSLLLIDPLALDFVFIQKRSFDQYQTSSITFAILDSSVDIFLKTLHDDEHGRNYTINISNGSSMNATSIDHVFIEYEQTFVQIAVLHQQKFYYLIRQNTVKLPDGIELQYGDTNRVIEPSETQLLNNANASLHFFCPQNVAHFLWLYKTSKFLECNRELANTMENEYKLYQNASQLNLTVIPMRNVGNGLNSLEKHYWLAGGTLLGWYRHCGLIPFTQDADFGLFAEEYDESIRNHFLGNPISYLWGALGLVNDSLEFRLYTGRYTLDLFWAYREGDHRWCGYQVHRSKFRRTLPLLPSLCSGDLFGYRFSIPCDPVEYLNAEYGPGKWERPLEKGYSWINMKYHSYWNDISWMYATRLYTRNGKLRTDKFAIDWIAKHFNYTFTSIPSFLNVIPTEPVTLPPLKTELVYVSSASKHKKKGSKPKKKSPFPPSSKIKQE